MTRTEAEQILADIAAFLAATLGVLAALVCGGMLALCLMLIGG